MLLTEVDEFIGIPQAAFNLAVSAQTVYKSIKGGLLPAYKFGRSLRIRRKDFNAFVESRRAVERRA